jgi:hypothetical protein
MTGRATTLLMMLGPAALALSTIAAKPAKRYIWNASTSVPIGLYRLRPTGSQQRGILAGDLDGGDSTTDCRKSGSRCARRRVVNWSRRMTSQLLRSSRRSVSLDDRSERGDVRQGLVG